MKKELSLFVLFCGIFISNQATAQEVRINNNYVIEADGTPRHENASTMWNDMNVYPDATSKGSTNPPTYTKFLDNGSSSQGVWLWMFSATSEQEVYIVVQFPHSYKVGTAVYPHVHWTTSSEIPTRTNVVWGLEYSVITTGGNYSNTTIITGNSVITEIAISGTKQHLITSLPIILGTNLGISTILTGRLFRKVSDSADTFSDPVGLLGFDLHYEMDTEGSRNEFSK